MLIGRTVIDPSNTKTFENLLDDPLGTGRELGSLFSYSHCDCVSNIKVDRTNLEFVGKEA